MSPIAKKQRIDATEGPIFSKMVAFVIPLMLTNLIQQLYTVADNMVVGKFSPDPTALGGIGSSSSVVAFLTALFAGFAVGTAAVVSHDFGKRDNEAVSKGVHTSLMLAACVGVATCVVGFLISEPLLLLLNTKEQFLSTAVTYLRIRCIGLPFVAVYNNAAATLRSVGDSQSPLYILTASGLANVLLNFAFVVGFGMSADGVAYATLISQILSVVFVVWILSRRKNENYCVSFSSLKIDKSSAKRILKFAIPGTIQGSVAHIMNVFLTSSVNIFPAEVIEAKVVAGNIDTILSTIIATYSHVSITFTGQNRGAEKYDRIKKSLICSILQAVTVAFVLGRFLLWLREPIITLFIDTAKYDSDAIVHYASIIMNIMINGYIISGITQSLAGFIKGMGYSVPPMVISLMDMGVLRAIWIFGLFPMIQTLEFLYLIYPVSWGMSALCYIAVAVVIWKKNKSRLKQNDTALVKDA